MSELSEQSCIPCRGDVPPMGRSEIDEMMTHLHDDWQLVERNDVPRLRRTFSFGNFKQALDFTVAVGTVAEEQRHHPRIVTQWGSVTLDWWTHKIKGLHANDFVMASRSDGLYQREGAS
ncbi:MAG: 4a-hydroxytetrahydrobiopterin dehydratase [Spirochaetota bacterium]